MQELEHRSGPIWCSNVFAKMTSRMDALQGQARTWDASLGGYGQSSHRGVRRSPRLLPAACGGCGSSSGGMPAQLGVQVPAGASWLITGGGGALGLLAAAWFAASSGAAGGEPHSTHVAAGSAARCDAGHRSSDGGCSSSNGTSPSGARLALCTRSGRLSPGDLAQPGSVASLATAGTGVFASACVTVVRSDVGCWEEAAGAAAAVAAGAASVGLLHAAGTLMDATLANQTPAHIRAVFAPKVGGPPVGLALQHVLLARLDAPLSSLDALLSRLDVLAFWAVSRLVAGGRRGMQPQMALRSHTGDRTN